MEKELAAQLRVDRALLKKLRSSLLTKGADWDDRPGTGIYLTDSGEKKIRGALLAPAAPPQGPEYPPEPEPERRTLRVRAICVNPLILIGEPVEGHPRVTIKLLRGASPYYVRGMDLPGCYKLPPTELWAYDGPKPRTHGRL